LKKRPFLDSTGSSISRSGTGTRNETNVYEKAEISLAGETVSYDATVFPYVIRKREIELIKKVLQAKRPEKILDYGCGGGWLSLLLSRWGFDVVGVDASKNMLRRAKLACHEAGFIICDAMRLPLRDETFDCIIGISILHHLDLKKALKELMRVSLARSGFLFMEPNLLNPLSAIGRKLLPTELHTKEEKPFTPGYLKTALELADFSLERYFALFFLSFPVARLFKMTHVTLGLSSVRIISSLESALERLPGIGHLNSTIIAVGKTNR